MKQIIQDNYESTCKRGLITNDTYIREFLDKILEEYIELVNECKKTETKDFNMNIFVMNMKTISFELADVILVCLNFARHLDIDIEYFLKEKIKINYSRSLQ